MVKKSLTYLLTLLIIFTFSPITYASDGENEEILSFNVEKAVEHALENSMDMEIQNLELEKADVVYDQNRSNLKKTKKALDGDDDYVPRKSEVTADDNVNRAMVNNGASERSIKLAYNIAQWNIDLKTNEIKYNVQKSYYDLLQREKEEQIAQENLTLSQKQYEHGELKYSLGNISKQELTQLEMNLSEAQGVYDTAMMSADLEELSFKNTLGLPLDETIKLTDTIEFKEYEPIDLDEAIKTSLNTNLGIKAAGENYEVEKLVLEATEVRFPSITYRYKQKEVEVRQSERTLENAKTAVEMNVRSAYLNLNTSKKNIQSYKLSVIQSESLLDIVQTRFNLGEATSSDIAKVNINLMNSKKNLSQAIHAYNMAILDYEYSIGIGKGVINDISK